MGRRNKVVKSVISDTSPVDDFNSNIWRIRPVNALTIGDWFIFNDKYDASTVNNVLGWFAERLPSAASTWTGL